MTLSERRKFRAEVWDNIKDELEALILANGRANMSEARVKSAIKKLISIYTKEFDRPSNADGGYTVAVDLLKGYLKDEEFVENMTLHYGIL